MAVTDLTELGGNDYRVELDAYAGPLDLLLYLVKRHEIDLNDIPVAKLTEQYLRHIEVIKAIDMERAGEFLVMAATLLEIKSQMLVPRPEGEEGAADASETAEEKSDPRYELVQQLLAYKRFKDASLALERRGEGWSKRFAAHPVKPIQPAKPEGAEDEENAPPADLDLEDVSLMDLCEAFARILESIGQQKVEHQVTYDDTPISLHADDILDRLKRDGAITLHRVFEGRKRGEMIGLFLATLELVRQRKVRVVQEDEEIRLQPRPKHEQEDTPDDGHRDWRNPETGEVEYDWPDETARRRAERRARIRAARAAQGKLEDVPMLEAMDEDDLPDAEVDEIDEDDGEPFGEDDEA